MQMIDLMKRLAELDAKNSNNVKQNVAESDYPERELDPPERGYQPERPDDMDAFKQYRQRRADDARLDANNSNNGEQENDDDMEARAARAADHIIEYDKRKETYEFDPNDNNPEFKQLVASKIYQRGGYDDLADKILSSIDDESGDYTDYSMRRGEMGMWEAETTPPRLGPVVKYGKYHGPRKNEKTFTGSRHIGGQGEARKGKPGTGSAPTDRQVVGMGEGLEEGLSECGIMPEAGMDRPTPASFSLNATASSGDEVANMLTRIMTLSGVKQYNPDRHMEVPDYDTDDDDSVITGDPVDDDDSVITGDPVDDTDDIDIAKSAAQGPMGNSGGEVMRAMMDKMNNIAPDQEKVMDADIEMEMPNAMQAIGGPVETPDDFGSTDGYEESPVQDMADEVRDMADTLADVNDEQTQESYSNTPETTIGSYDTNLHAYQPNQGSGHGRGLANNPRGRATTETIEAELAAAYRNFISEADKKCNHSVKGKMCPVHGMKECSMNEGTLTLPNSWEETPSDWDYYRNPPRRPRHPGDDPNKIVTDLEAQREREYQLARSRIQREVDNVDGTAPNGRRYNTILTIRAPSQEDFDMELEKYAADSRSTEPRDLSYSEVTDTDKGVEGKIYFINYHRYGEFRPFKNEPAVSKKLYGTPPEKSSPNLSEMMKDLLRLAGLAEAKKPSIGLSKKKKSRVDKKAKRGDAKDPKAVAVNVKR